MYSPVGLKVANVEPSGAKAQQWVGAIVASDYNSVSAYSPRLGLHLCDVTLYSVKYVCMCLVAYYKECTVL